MQTTVEYDPVTHQYVRIYKIGEMTYRIPETMTFEEYQEEDNQTNVGEILERKGGSSEHR